MNVASGLQKKKKKFIYKILTSLTGHGTSRGIYFKSIFLSPFIQKINLLTSYMTYRYIYIYIFLQIDTCHNEYSPHNSSLYLLNQKNKDLCWFLFLESVCVKEGNTFKCFWLFLQKQREGGWSQEGICAQVVVRVAAAQDHTEALRGRRLLFRWSPLPLQPLTECGHLQMCTMGR